MRAVGVGCVGDPALAGDGGQIPLDWDQIGLFIVGVFSDVEKL